MIESTGYVTKSSDLNREGEKKVMGISSHFNTGMKSQRNVICLTSRMRAPVTLGGMQGLHCANLMDFHPKGKSIPISKPNATKTSI